MSAAATISLMIPDERSYFPFNKLPLELKTRIVELVDEQDVTYRDRINNFNAYKPNLGLSSKSYGKGLSQLALCSSELGELASVRLYSDLNEKLAQSTSFLSDILPRHRYRFKSVTLINGGQWSAEHRGRNLMLALPHLRNVTSLIVKEYLPWMTDVTRVYGEHPLNPIASDVRHLELNVWGKPYHDDSDDNILRDRDFIKQLLTPFSHITSLNIACEFISIKTLQEITGMNQLKNLTISTDYIDLEGISPGTLSWVMGTSIVSASVRVYERWSPWLFRWIQAFGYQLQNLGITCGVDFPAADPSEDLFNFPTLLHLTIKRFEPVLWLRILKHFQASPLAHLTFSDKFHIWVPGRKAPIAKEYLRVDIISMLEKVGKVFTGRSTRRHHREAQALVKAMCERGNLLYRYNASWLAPPKILPSHYPIEDRQELKESVSPLVAYVNRAMDRIAAGQNGGTSQEFLKALTVLRNLRDLDEE